MRTNYSVKNSISSFISNILSCIFLFVGKTFFIRIFTVEYLGLNGLFTNILTLLSLFELGIGTAITCSLYKYVKIDDKETIKSIMHFYKKAYNCIAIIVFIIGLLIIPFLKYIVKEVFVDVNIYVIYMLFLISTVSSYFISYKRNIIFVNQKNYIINIVHILYIIVMNILQILTIYITKNYYLYLIVKIVCTLLENIVISIRANIEYPYLLEKNVGPLDKTVKTNIVNKVKAIVIHKVSSVVTYGTDNIIISSFLGIKIVGLYSNYYSIIHMMVTIFSNVITSTTASVGNLLVEKNYNKNYEIFRKIRFFNLWIAISISVGLFLVIEPFIIIWIGEQYILDKVVLIVLMVNFFQTMMRNTYGLFREAAGIWIEDKYVPIIQALLNIVCSIVFLKIIGLAGVFIGTIISSLTLWCYTFPRFIYKNLFNKSIKHYILECTTHIVIFIGIMFASYEINLFSSNIIVSSIIAITVPNAILFIIFRNTDEFKYYKDLFKSILINNVFYKTKYYIRKLKNKQIGTDSKF